MELELIRPNMEYKYQIIEMMDEWSSTGERIVPYAIRRIDYHNFDEYIYEFNQEINGPIREGFVRNTTYFAYQASTDKIIGAVNIRHTLNEELLKAGGHIGDGVRPSERRKGYATEMICLALNKCRELEINRVMMSCDKDNIGSAKSIIKNGGKLEREFMNEEGVMEQIYWIDLR